MPDFSPSGNYYVYPTFGTAGQGIGAQVYKGSYHSEMQLAPLLAQLAAGNFTVSGLTVPGSSASLMLSVALGVAVIGGRVVSIPGATSVTCTANATNYGFLKLEKDADGYAISVAVEVNTTGTAPADSTPLFIAIAGSSTISATTSLLVLGPPRGKQNRMTVFTTAGANLFAPQFTGTHTALAVGGGGSGGTGWGQSGPIDYYSRGGGGGGGGAAVFGQFTLAIGSPITVTVGAGGALASNGSGTTQSAGHDGGDSIVGTLTAAGGKGGAAGDQNITPAVGGAGGIAAGGANSFGVNGTPGLSGAVHLNGTPPAAEGGNGGIPGFFRFIGVGGVGTVLTSTGTAPSGIGAGSCGARGEVTTPNTTGTDSSLPGMPGMVILFW